MHYVSVGSGHWLAKGESLTSCGPASELRRQDGDILQSCGETEGKDTPRRIVLHHPLQLADTLLIHFLYNSLAITEVLLLLVCIPFGVSVLDLTRP